jgi:hypothetical protein
VSRSCMRRRTSWRRACSEESELALMNVVRSLTRGRLSALVGADRRPAHRPLPTVKVACGATDRG